MVPPTSQGPLGLPPEPPPWSSSRHALEGDGPIRTRRHHGGRGLLPAGALWAVGGVPGSMMLFISIMACVHTRNFINSFPSGRFHCGLN